MRRGALPPPRVLAVVVPVCLAGVVTYALAAISFARDPHSPTTLLGILGVLADAGEPALPIRDAMLDDGVIASLLLWLDA